MPALNRNKSCWIHSFYKIWQLYKNIRVNKKKLIGYGYSIKLLYLVRSFDMIKDEKISINIDLKISLFSAKVTGIVDENVKL